MENEIVVGANFFSIIFTSDYFNDFGRQAPTIMEASDLCQTENRIVSQAQLARRQQ